MNDVQRLKNLEGANGRRFRIAQLKRDIKAGKVTLDKVVANPPEEMIGRSVVDILRLQPSRRPAWMVVLGRDALTEGVNLMLPIEVLSKRDRAWLVGWLRDHISTNGRIFPVAEGAQKERPTSERSPRLSTPKEKPFTNTLELLPLEPFMGWCDRMRETDELTSSFENRMGMTAGTLYRANRAGQVTVDVVDKTACHIGDPMLLMDLYPELYDEPVAA